MAKWRFQTSVFLNSSYYLPPCWATFVGADHLLHSSIPATSYKLQTLYYLVAFSNCGTSKIKLTYLMMQPYAGYPSSIPLSTSRATISTDSCLQYLAVFPTLQIKVDQLPNICRNDSKQSRRPSFSVVWLPILVVMKTIVWTVCLPELTPTSNQITKLLRNS